MVREIFLENTDGNVKKDKNVGIDFSKNILCHFSYSKGMKDFSTRFHRLWDECFADIAISSIKPIVGCKRVNNLQEYLVKKKPDRSVLEIGS